MFVRMASALALVVCAVSYGCGADRDAASLEGEDGTPFVSIGTISLPLATRNIPEPVTQPTIAPPPSPTVAPEPVRVIQGGYAPFTDSDGSIRTPWAVVIQNPSDSRTARDTRVSALFFDANGVLLDTDVDYVNTIAPGQTTAAGSSFFSPGGAPVRMEVRVDGTRFETADGPAPLVASDITLVPDRYVPAVTGKVANPLATDLESLALTCIVQDANNQFLAVGRSFLTLLPASTTAIGTCNFDPRHDISAASTVALFAGYSILTLNAMTPAP